MIWKFVWGDSNKYLNHMFYEEIRTKQDRGPFLHIKLLIKCSVQQPIYFNGNIFGNKCCRCNEGSLYWDTFTPSILALKFEQVKFELLFKMYKTAGWVANSVDTDQTLPSVVSIIPQI